VSNSAFLSARQSVSQSVSLCVCRFVSQSVSEPNVSSHPTT